MLKGHLIRPRLDYSAGRVIPRQLPLDYRWLAVATDVIALFQQHVGSSRGTLAAALQDAALLLGPMTREELRVVIERPAEKQGAAFEEGLVDRILDDPVPSLDPLWKSVRVGPEHDPLPHPGFDQSAEIVLGCRPR